MSLTTEAKRSINEKSGSVTVAENRRRSQAERTETTRRLILDQAYQLFGKNGYSKTSLDDIVVQCGLTRGALYHHFNGKKELFSTLVLDVEHEMHEAIASAAGKTPREKFDKSIDIFFDYCAIPEFRQIVLLDGPAILGMEHWSGATEHAREHHLYELVPQLLPDDASDAYRSAFTNIVLGGMKEVASMIAQSDDPDGTRQAARDVLHNLISQFSPT